MANSDQIKLSDSMLEAMENADSVAMTQMISVPDLADAEAGAAGSNDIQGTATPGSTASTYTANTNTKSDGKRLSKADNSNNNEDDNDNEIITEHHDDHEDHDHFAVHPSMEEEKAHRGHMKTQSQVLLGAKGMRYYHNAKLNNNDGYYYLIPDSKRLLFFEFKIKRISSIDTSEETFRCSFHFYLTWLAEYSDYENYLNLKKNKKEKTYQPQWTPKFSLINVVDVHEKDSKIKYYIQDSQSNPGSFGENEWAFGHLSQKMFGFEPWKGRFNRCKYSYEATFAEQFELDSFPFDCQDLSIVIKMDQHLNFADMIPFPRKHTDFISFDSSFSATGEWTYEGLLSEFSKTDKVFSKANREYSKVNISVKSKRNWRAHLSSFIIVACMFALGLCSFAMDYRIDGIDDRLGFGITLLLADVATMQFIFGNVPNIPYFTLFDKYVHYCFRFLFAIIIWCSILGLIDRFCTDFDDIFFKGSCDEGIVITIDYIMFVVFIIIFIICHIVLWREASYSIKRENSKKHMSSRELEYLFDHNKNLVLQEKKVMYVNCAKWEENDYILNEGNRQLHENTLKESFPNDIVGFAQIRQTVAQAQREQTRAKFLKHSKNDDPL